MADFIQTFTLDDNLVNFIMNNLKIDETDNQINYIDVKIPELDGPMNMMIREFIKEIDEYNYFPPKNTPDVYDFMLKIKRIPPRTFENWNVERGPFNFNFYIFLKDSDSIYEVFNPFVKKTIRFRITKGLVVLFPSSWLILSRHTNTYETDCILIKGTTSTFLYNLDQQASSDTIQS